MIGNLEKYSAEKKRMLEQDIRNRQAVLAACDDPDAGIDRVVQCHNLDRSPLQRWSMSCQSVHDYYRPGNPAGKFRVIYTLEDGRFLVEAPDEHNVARYYIADEKTHLVLVEDVTRQFVDEDRDYITGALPTVIGKVVP